MKKNRYKTKYKHNKFLNFMFVSVVILCAFAVTISEYVGGPLPTWDDLYALAAGQSHVAIEAENIENSIASIHFIDVGQGDATLIEQGGEYCLIDAGDASSGETVVNYLNSAGVKEIALLVMTHEHTDHIGGMVDVMENFEVETVLLPVFSNEEPLDGYNILRTLEYIDTQGIPTITAGAGQTYMLGTGELNVIDIGIQNSDNRNNSSIITMFNVNNFSYLSCGDAEIEQTSYLVENNYNLNADIYKAAHHGAANGNYTQLLQSIMPSLVTISCSIDNSYGHPHEESLAAFEEVGAVTVGTHEKGDIVVNYTADDEIFVTTSGESLQIVNAA